MTAPSTIALLVFDADGVMTDGRIILDHAGNDIRAFDVQDGMAITLWRQAGGKTAILTGRSSQALAHRAAELQIDHVLQACDDKRKALEQLLRDLNLQPAQACFIGDDLPDLAAMHHCGYAIAVANAVPEVKAAAHYITTRPGGRGGIRQAVEHLLKRTGRWAELLAAYDA